MEIIGTKDEMEGFNERIQLMEKLLLGETPSIDPLLAEDIDKFLHDTCPTWKKTFTTFKVLNVYRKLDMSCGLNINWCEEYVKYLKILDGAFVTILDNLLPILGNGPSIYSDLFTK